jgi:hypothetical protein
LNVFFGNHHNEENIAEQAEDAVNQNMYDMPTPPPMGDNDWEGKGWNHPGAEPAFDGEFGKGWHGGKGWNHPGAHEDGEFGKGWHGGKGWNHPGGDHAFEGGDHAFEGGEEGCMIENHGHGLHHGEHGHGHGGPMRRMMNPGMDAANCHDDADTFCGDLRGFERLVCVTAHFDVLSEGCRMVIDQTSTPFMCAQQVIYGAETDSSCKMILNHSPELNCRMMMGVCPAEMGSQQRAACLSDSSSGFNCLSVADFMGQTDENINNVGQAEPGFVGMDEEQQQWNGHHEWHGHRGCHMMRICRMFTCVFMVAGAFILVRKCFRCCCGCKGSNCNRYPAEQAGRPHRLAMQGGGDEKINVSLNEPLLTSEESIMVERVHETNEPAFQYGV